MTLEDIQRRMHAAVKDLQPVEVVAAELGMDPERLAIYRRMVRSHVHTAVAGRLPVSTALLGAPDDTPAWQALFEAYLAECPPSAPTLPEAAAAFPGFLGRRAEAGEVAPFTAAVAELEWAAFQVNRDPTQLPDPKQLSAPVLNPTLQIMSWPWPVTSFVVAWQRGERPAEPSPAEELTLVFRRPATGHPCYHVATPDLLFVLKMVHDGLSVEAAAQISGQGMEAVEAALAGAVGIGLVIAPG